MSPRRRCWTCHRPTSHCYCRWLKPFTPGVRFLILMHPMEARRPIATGRMTHLSLSNSALRVGIDFTHDPVVNASIRDYSCYVLFPDKNAVPAVQVNRTAERPTCVILPDGTWRTVKRMMRESLNLRGLPRIGLDPRHPSGFLVRRQPREGCLATIEATAELLEMWGESGADRLRDTFRRFVHQQLVHSSADL